MYASLMFLAVLIVGGLFVAYVCIKQSFFFGIDLNREVLKQQSKIGKIVLALSCATIGGLLLEHDRILPHRKLIVLMDPVFLLSVSCALYIIHEISSTMVMNEYRWERKYNVYMPIGYLDRWGAANQAMGVVGLLSFGFAYILIGASVFFGK